MNAGKASGSSGSSAALEVLEAEHHALHNARLGIADLHRHWTAREAIAQVAHRGDEAARRQIRRQGGGAVGVGGDAHERREDVRRHVEAVVERPVAEPE